MVSGSSRASGIVWVSAEVKEEILDILALLTESGLPIHTILVDAPVAILETMKLPTVAGEAKVIPRPYGHDFGTNPLAKIRSLFSFSGRVLRRRPAMIFSGYSMMKHRLASWWLRVPHVAYVRGMLYDAAIEGGLATNIRNSGIGRLFPDRVVRPYGADLSLTIGELNRGVLIDRGASPDAVRVIGAIWLQNLPTVESRRAPTRGRVFFLTAAWEAHGHLDEHAAQLDVTAQLVRDWPGSLELAIRKHPRDQYDYRNDSRFRHVAIDGQDSTLFLASLTQRDLLIAPLSTLAFEADSLGIQVVFYEHPIATGPYETAYKRLGILPRTIEQILSGEIEPQVNPPKLLASFDAEAVRSSLRWLMG